ncbi:hypothetical protein PQO03_05995 [Lentisphaera profundi]|uniref:Uncharacterized protein n=1 Tax=Lentisphaera profundi TaxID=1658616 RepID=A0ABY7VMM1_9BACT|nr:hypothetical protein [Lentisphaera profundi]WDE95271.1 hypothetical protein PQO03_05995 [Lentisphaera profundi]
MPVKELSCFSSHDTEFVYFINEDQTVGFSLYPRAKNTELVEHRENINDLATSVPIIKVFGGDWPAYNVHDLVQIKCVGEVSPGAFSAGSSMRSTESNLLFQDQRLEGNEVITVLKHKDFNLEVEHKLEFNYEDDYVLLSSKVINRGETEVKLENLSSFCLDGLSPFHKEDGEGAYYFHRFLSTWSAEGRHEVRSVEDCNFERSWTGHGARTMRYGQVGSMPVKDYPESVMEHA